MNKMKKTQESGKVKCVFYKKLNANIHDQYPLTWCSGYIHDKKEENKNDNNWFLLFRLKKEIYS